MHKNGKKKSDAARLLVFVSSFLNGSKMPERFACVYTRPPLQFPFVKELLATCKIMLKGMKGLYILSFVLQFFWVVCSVFSSFMMKVVVDTLTGSLEQAAYIESWIVTLLSGGKGNAYLYDHIETTVYALLTAAFVSAIVMFCRFRVRAACSTKCAANMRKKLYDHMLELPYSEYKVQKAGDLIQTCTRDVDLVRRFLTMDLSQLSYTLFIIILCFSILVSISWKLTLVSLAGFPFLFVYAFFLIKEVRKRYRATDEVEAELVDKMSQNLDGVRLVKAYNLERKEIGEFEKQVNAYKRAFKHEKILGSFFYGSSDIFIFASRTVALVYGLYLVIDQGPDHITAGTLVISYTFVNMMVWPLRSCATTMSNLGQTLASSDRIQKLLAIETEDRISGITTPITGDVEFSHVSFAYPDEPDIPVLNDVSFKISKGQTIAIMGATGSGKSTLSNLLCGLYPLKEGTIKIDGVKVEDYSLAHLRRNVAAVLQEPFLFSKSVYDNIKIAQEDATKEEVEYAANVASVDEAIQSFRDGYQTPVGEKGVTLSGGQKQRLAIARTVISKAPILIFDDSLSAVDSATDLAIRAKLKSAQKSSTVILITHRYMSAKDADLILVLEAGRIVESGNNEELLKLNGVYKKIADIQARLS